MKTIKIMKFMNTMLIPVFILGMYSTSFSQEKVEKKEVKVKMVKEVNGERVVIDTTFNASSLEDLQDMTEVQEFLKNNDLNDLNFNVVDVDDLSDLDIEVIESDDNDKVITKTIMIKSSGEGDIDLEKEYNITIITSDSAEQGKVMKVQVDGSSKAYFFSDDKDGDTDVDNKKQVIVIKKNPDGKESNIMVTDGDLHWTSEEEGKSIQIKEGDDGKKTVIIENEDGTTKEIVMDGNKGAYMIDEAGNLNKVGEEAEWVDDNGEMITLNVTVDDNDKTIIIKENGNTIDIKDLDENHNVWVYSSDNESNLDKDAEVFVEVIKKKDGDKTITIKKKVILMQVCEKDMENFEKSGVDLAPGMDNKLELENLVFAPNPSNGKFTLKFKTSETGRTSINIYDINGNEVYSENIKNSDSSYEKEIDISSEGKGTYFLKIQQGDKFSTRKIILE